MSREQPCCQTGPRWIQQRLQNRNALAPLTGQDARALQAFTHLVALYGSSDGHGQHAAVAAMTHVVGAMQPKTRHLAKAVIPHILDWGDEDRIWREVEEALTAEQREPALRR